MNIRKEFKTIILPLIKGLPLTIFLIVVAFMATKRMIVYTNPTYQADGAIRIDLKDNSVNANVLFDQQGGGKGGYSFLTEVESFRSKSLIKQTLESLNFGISYFRVGEIKTSELYSQCPISINFTSSSEKNYDKPFYIKYLDNNQFLMSSNEIFEGPLDTIQFDKLFVNEDLVMTIRMRPEVVAKNAASLQIDDVFMFRFNSIDALQEEINSTNLFIKPIDKEIQVIRVYYQHEVPEKTELFVNALMETYIRTCQDRISDESEITLNFIDDQISVIGSKLKTAESQLAGFKAENGIINSKQETDATLKEIMQLDLQKVNYKMQEKELKDLFEFLSSGNDLQEFSPNFESLRDPVFRDAYMQAQKYELQKFDLELKYTQRSEEIITINAKINNLRTFIHESVKNTLANLTQRRVGLEEKITSINESIQTLPNKERQIVVLEREVKLNEQLYNLMMGKRMEIAISKTASVVKHQIIDPAKLGKSPIAPNKGLIYGVAIFFALLFGILFSFIGNFLFATIKSKEDLLELVDIPIIGTVTKTKKGSEDSINSFANLYTNLEILKQKHKNGDKGLMVATTSLLPNEGKTFVATNLGKAFAYVGKKVLIVDMDVRKPDVHKAFGVDNSVGGLSAILKGDLSPKEAIVSSGVDGLDLIPAGQLDDIFSAIIFSSTSIEFIEKLKPYYDFILIDTPPLNLVVDAVPLMHQSDFNLFVSRVGVTKLRKAKMIQPLLEEFQIPNIYTVLNSVKGKSQNNYNYKRKNKAPKEEAVL